MLKKLLIIISIICSIFAVLIVVLPFINNASVNTQIKGSNDIQVNYTTTEINTWDVSENGDGSVNATLSADGVLTISGIGNMKDWSSISNVPWYNVRKQIKSVKIEEGVTSIGKNAFYWCSSLTEIVIPSSVTSIRDYAFKECSSLIKIAIPETVTSIGNSAFRECSSLTDITIPEGVISIGKSAFYGCGILTEIMISSSITNIGDSVFSGCSSLTQIKVDSNNTKYCDDNGVLYTKDKTEIIKYPEGKREETYTILNGVQRIGDYAFSGCTSLTEIVIPEGVTSIGWEAFYGCSSLTEIVIPNSVTSIRSYAFDGCSNLTDITIPEGVTWVSGSVFNRCSSLTQIKVDSNNTTYCDDNGVLYSKDKTEIIKYPAGKKDDTYTILNGVTSIGEYAFFTCSSLKEITIPEGVAYIGNYAFSECSSLTEITMPEGVTSIGEEAFSECSSLTEITIPRSVTVIRLWAFYKSKITVFTNSNTVELPDILKRAQDETDILYSSKEFTLQNCTIEEEKIKINEGASYASIEVEDGKLDGLKYIISYNGWDISENADRSITAVLDENGCLAISGTGKMKDWKTNENAPWYGVRQQIKRVKIEEGVTSIGEYAFYVCSSLTEITIPEGVTTIGRCAFDGCSSLKEIIIPEGVTSIGNRAFCECSSLTKITIPEGVTSIKYELFSECSSLIEIIIPEEVTSIEGDAFRGCSSLIEIIIPEGVTSISGSAFNGCSSLTQIKVDSSNIKYCDDNGVLYLKDNTEIIKYPEGKKDAKYKILKGVTSIGEYAFYVCSSLTEITIPEGVTSIGNSAFDGCRSLTEIKVDENNTKYLDDNGVLYTKDKTEIIKYPRGKKDTTYVILSGVTRVRNCAFGYCSSLKEITIPKTVTSIEMDAFYGCTNLTIICKSNTTAETYAKDEGINYMVDDDGPVIRFTTNGTSTKVKSTNTQVIVEDTVAGVDYSSLKYYWGTESEEVTEEQITTSFTNNETIITPQNSGNYYLWIYAKDLLGNATIERSNVFEIDIDPPTANISYSTTVPTNQDVTVTITANEEIQVVEGWTLSGDKLKLTKVYSINTETSGENITIKDIAGNEITINVKITNIDKTAPTANVTYKLSSKKDNCTVEIIVNEEIQEVEGWAISTDKKTIAKTYKRNTTEDITIKDVVGNETTVKIEITKIEDVLEMSSYEIKGKYIGKINPKTLFKDFIKGIYTNMEYKLKEGDKTVADTSIMKTGQTLTIGNKSYTIVVRGDINGDGKVGIAELARTSRLGISQEDATELEMMALDVNMDGSIKVNDLATISRLARE